MSNIPELSQSMADNGVIYEGDFIIDDQIHRFKPKGSHSPNGYYSVFDNVDFMVAIFGDWSLSDKAIKWCSKGFEKFSPEQRAEAQAKMKQNQEDHERCVREAAEKARSEAAKIWNESSVISSHPYLASKGIDKPIGIKLYQHKHHGDCLAIPLYDDLGLSSLQFIFISSENKTQKRFLPHGLIKGCSMTIGEPSKRILLAEGYATAWTLHKATGDMVVVAFTCHNLVKVATRLASKYDKPILICADNDTSKQENKGIESAIKASSITAYPYTYPTLTTGSDFNDLMLSHGIEEVRGQLSLNMVKPKSMDVVKHLVTLDSGAYIDLKKQYAKRLGVAVKDLDTLVREVKKENASDAHLKPYEASVKPCIDPVNGNQVALEIKRLLNAYLALPDWCDVAITLWIIASYTYDCFRIFPRLLLTSPEKGCGKTTTLDLIDALSNKPLSASNVTAAAIFRSIEKWHPTLLIDEADTFLSKDSDNPELRGILNSGHTKTKAFTMRVVGEGKEMEPRQFSTWAPMVIAMIKLPAATLVDRSVVIELQKKLLSHKLEQLPMDISKRLSSLKSKVMRFCKDNQERFASFTRNDVPEHQNARTGDNWMPLFAIAHALGDKWPAMAKSAFTAISVPNTAEDDVDKELLNDIKTIFEENRIDKIFTKILLDKLCNIEDAPWSKWKRGNPMDGRALSRRLTPYNIKSQTIRIGHETYKGYEKTWFKNAWNRYLTTEREAHTPKIDVTASQLNDTNGCSRHTPSVTKKPYTSQRHSVTDKLVNVTDSVTDKVTLKANDINSCDVVTDVTANTGGGVSLSPSLR